MEVIGEDGNIYEIEGDDDDEVEGDVMGDVLGYDDDGDVIVGARRRRRHRKHKGGGALVRVRKPHWRESQLAPGVIAPDQGLLPLPMAGTPSNTFSLAVQNITFVGQLQKPFRGERLLVSTVRTGATATGLLLGQLFVGTDLSQLDVTQFDVEQVGDPNAFGVRLAVKPAQPGVLIRLVVALSTPIAGADTIQTSVTLLGRNIH
jgi:hypothetical protein